MNSKNIGLAEAVAYIHFRDLDKAREFAAAEPDGQIIAMARLAGSIGEESVLEIVEDLKSKAMEGHISLPISALDDVLNDIRSGILRPPSA